MYNNCVHLSYLPQGMRGSVWVLWLGVEAKREEKAQITRV